MSRAPNLRRLQEWMALVMRHPATADVALRSKPAQAHFAAREVEAGAVVVPNERMTVAQRLQVYNGAYLSRLMDVLASDYGALQHLIGHAAWHRLCARYVDRHPSDHPNLNRFGRHMPAFVRGQRWLEQRAFAAELAALELAISQAFDAAAFTPLQPERLGAIAPEDWSRARLIANPSLRLLAFRHPTNAWFTAFRDDRPEPAPPPGRSHVAIYRKDYRVLRLDLDARAFAVLLALQAGEPLEQALARARGGDVGAWFQAWSADGLFTDVRLGRPG